MTARKDLQAALARAKADHEKAVANLDVTATRIAALAARSKAADEAGTPESGRHRLGEDRRKAVSNWAKAVEDRRKALYDRRNPGADLARAEADLHKADADLRRATAVLEELERELGKD